MGKILENFSSLLLMVLFVGGYFPVNMILSYMYGDKADVAISFFVPFYGYFVLIFG